MKDSNNSKELLSKLNFCVIDLETTGGNLESDQIIEIGMVRIENLAITDKKNYLIDPEIAIPEFIQKLTSIRQRDVKGSPKISEVIHEIKDFIRDDIIVAHNISFDYPFLNSVFERLGLEKLENKGLCTNVMTKHMIPEIMSSNLSYMSQLFGLGHSKAHRAYDDALATAKLLLKFLDIFIEKNITKVNQLYYPRNKFELDRVHFGTDKNGDSILEKALSINGPMVLTFKGEKGLIVALLPIENSQNQKAIIKSYLEHSNWKRVTIKLTGPVIEGLFQFNNHFLKYPEEHRQEILDYLNDFYSANENLEKIDYKKIDFLLAHHLVKDQIIVYNFLNLNTQSKSIFKFPAQRKKLINHLKSLSKKFESKQKGSKSSNIVNDLVPVIENHLTCATKDKTYLFLTRKMLKDNESHIFNSIEKFIQSSRPKFNFPTKHL